MVRRLVGVDPDVVARPPARSHGVLGDAHDERLVIEHRPARLTAMGPVSGVNRSSARSDHLGSLGVGTA